MYNIPKNFLFLLNILIKIVEDKSSDKIPIDKMFYTIYSLRFA